MQKTYMQKTADIKRDWHLVDADGQILGRLASEIAQKLIGKHKPTYTPHMDGGDYVVVTNASKFAVTGKKETDKIYYRHSGFPGGLKQKPLGELRESYPTRIIEKAVFNMLPKNKLRSERMNRLKVYKDTDHKHESQLAK
jgi:large subunit ribosomal protein L13